MVAHQLGSLTEIGGRAHVDPCALDGIVGYFASGGYRAFDKVGGVGTCIRCEGAENTVGEYVYPGIGVVGI